MYVESVYSLPLCALAPLPPTTLSYCSTSFNQGLSGNKVCDSQLSKYTGLHYFRALWFEP